jgi:ABC-type Mn2+/Zn2+ transport system permease subunit
LVLSYYFNLTAGACIILTAGSGFFVSLALERILHRPRAAHAHAAAPQQR